jgi:mono/diheme cytochrome c family protein
VVNADFRAPRRSRTAAGRPFRHRATWLAALVILPLATGCEWFTDFKRQPSVWTWEPIAGDSTAPIVRGAPQGSVPRGGTEVAAFQVSYLAAPGQIDSIGRLLTNPVPVSEESLANGRKYFQINCAVCHGDRGMGDGTAVKYGMVGMSMMNDLLKNRPDGYIFGMMRNGRGLMPTYNRIEERDRWDVVNYIRALQGKVTGIPFETGPLARPGVTGDKLPGRTDLGPTREVPPVIRTPMHSAPGAAAPRADSAGGARPGGQP